MQIHQTCKLIIRKFVSLQFNFIRFFIPVTIPIPFFGTLDPSFSHFFSYQFKFHLIYKSAMWLFSYLMEAETFFIYAIASASVRSSVSLFIVFFSLLTFKLNFFFGRFLCVFVSLSICHQNYLRLLYSRL